MNIPSLRESFNPIKHQIKLTNDKILENIKRQEVLFDIKRREPLETGQAATPIKRKNVGKRFDSDEEVEKEYKNDYDLIEEEIKV